MVKPENDNQKLTKVKKAESGADGLTVTIKATPETVPEGGVILLQAEITGEEKEYSFEWDTACKGRLDSTIGREVHWDTTGLHPGGYVIKVTVTEGEEFVDDAETAVTVTLRTVAKGDTLPVTMRRTAAVATPDLPLWVVIRKSTEDTSFDNYDRYIQLVLCGPKLDTNELDRNKWAQVRKGKNGDPTSFDKLRKRRFLPYNDADAYRLLKIATEAFLVVNCAVKPDLEGFTFTEADVAYLVERVGADGTLSLDKLNTLWRGNKQKGYLEKVNEVKTLLYLKLIRDKLADVRLKPALFAEDEGDGDLPEECYGILEEKLSRPCMIELIWSYWHEEGMLVQTTNAISRRFQNIRGPGERDPLAMLEIDPLRPLNNLLWGYIQDEQHRLSVVRRAYEYDHHYGLSLQGKAVPAMRTADSRSKFLEAFHNLLYLSWAFFKEDDDTTVISDGFPVLNALKEVHLLLTEGAHNQFGDLPSTARIEMLMQQWLLARPEFREFLPTRTMVAYPEPWMDRVDAMKRVQGWTDVSIREFRDLGVFGERILLSARFGAWLKADDMEQAKNWARFWRPEIQGYIHSYRAATGVDLTVEPTDPRQAALRSTRPSALLMQRLALQQREEKALETKGAPATRARGRLSTRT